MCWQVCTSGDNDGWTGKRGPEYECYVSHRLVGKLATGVGFLSVETSTASRSEGRGAVGFCDKIAKVLERTPKGPTDGMRLMPMDLNDLVFVGDGSDAQVGSLKCHTCIKILACIVFLRHCGMYARKHLGENSKLSGS